MAGQLDSPRDDNGVELAEHLLLGCQAPLLHLLSVHNRAITIGVQVSYIYQTGYYTLYILQTGLMAPSLCTQQGDHYRLAIYIRQVTILYIYFRQDWQYSLFTRLSYITCLSRCLVRILGFWASSIVISRITGKSFRIVLFRDQIGPTLAHRGIFLIKVVIFSSKLQNFFSLRKKRKTAKQNWGLKIL